MATLLDILTTYRRQVHSRRFARGSFWLDFYLTTRVWPPAFVLDAGRRLLLPGLNAGVDFEHRFLASLYASMVDSAETGDLYFQQGENGAVQGTVNEITIALNEMVDFWTLKEILINKDYGCTLPPETVVIDVGMNIGVASLWFASMDNVKQVYGYEPFTPTYESCLANLRLNPAIGKKIAAYNIGVDAVDREVTVQFDAAQATGAGVYGFGERFRGSKIKTQTIKLARAATLVEQVRANHPHSPIFMKIDCEGSEFDIIPHLAESDALKELAGLVVESHRPDIGPLLAALSTNFSSLFYHYRLPPSVAMIYASGGKSPGA